MSALENNILSFQSSCLGALCFSRSYLKLNGFGSVYLRQIVFLGLWITLSSMLTRFP